MAKEFLGERERFLQNVVIGKDHWIWKGSIASNGYGKINRFGTRIALSAHRYSYELFVGPVPDGKQVQHKHEGMKLCVRPECLKLGEDSENKMDYVKVFHRFSSQKLNADQVKEIKYSKLSNNQLAKQFNVSSTTICHIRSGKTWREV